MISTLEEKKLRGLTFQYWLENNCCDLESVAKVFDLNFPIIAKWRRQDNWDKKAKEMIKIAATERQKNEKGSEAEMYDYHLKLIRFMIAKFSKLLNELNEEDVDLEPKLNLYKNNLLGLINMEQALKKGTSKIDIKELEQMYYIPPSNVTNELSENLGGVDEDPMD